MNNSAEKWGYLSSIKCAGVSMFCSINFARAIHVHNCIHAFMFWWPQIFKNKSKKLEEGLERKFEILIFIQVLPLSLFWLSAAVPITLLCGQIGVENACAHRCVYTHAHTVLCWVQTYFIQWHSKDSSHRQNVLHNGQKAALLTYPSWREPAVPKQQWCP